MENLSQTIITIIEIALSIMVVMSLRKMFQDQNQFLQQALTQQFLQQAPHLKNNNLSLAQSAQMAIGMEERPKIILLAHLVLLIQASNQVYQQLKQIIKLILTQMFKLMVRTYRQIKGSIMEFQQKLKGITDQV